MKKTIQLTEGEIKQIITESVKYILNENCNMNSPLYWKNTCLQYIKAIEQEINSDYWEDIPSVIDGLQMCYDNYKKTTANISQQALQQRMQQQPQQRMQQQPQQRMQ
jgi:hypothetical protein